MSYRTISGFTQAIDIRKEPIGKVFEGVYRGRREIPSDYGKQWVYEFVDENGEPFAFYGLTVLNRAMEEVPIGTQTRITWEGKETIQTKKGARQINMVKVEVDESPAPTRDLDDPVNLASLARHFGPDDVTA